MSANDDDGQGEDDPIGEQLSAEEAPVAAAVAPAAETPHDVDATT